MIPILINNRDRLTTTRRLFIQCRVFSGSRTFIVDNASTYPPLLDWYRDTAVPVARLEKNHGPRAPQVVLAGLQKEWEPFDYYVITDSDLDVSGVPRDVLDVLQAGLERYPWAVKAGLSLEISDIPDSYPFKGMVLEREAPQWQDRIDHQFYRGSLDTTFAMYRVKPPWNGDYGPALRTARPYTARHVPWYIDPKRRDAEELYYLQHLDPSGIFWSALAQEEFREKVS